MISIRAQELCESRGSRPGLPSLLTYGFRGRKATLNQLIGEYLSEMFSGEYTPLQLQTQDQPVYVKMPYVGTCRERDRHTSEPTTAS